VIGGKDRGAVFAQRRRPARWRRAPSRRNGWPCREYGRNLGISFQLVDDALDLSGLPA